MPKFEPEKWNDKDKGGKKQKSSNCYDYAIDRPREDRPVGLEPPKTWGSTPGRKHGKQPPVIDGPAPLMTCKQLTDGAIADGLTESSKDGTCGTDCWKVALFILPFTPPGGQPDKEWGTDFHWMREDSPGSWSHKPGNGEATNKDDDGKEITDPEKAKTKYRLCGYFCVCPKNVEIAMVGPPPSQPPTAVLSLRVRSGVDDPAWVLGAAEIATIRDRLGALPAARGSVPEGMGYRGFLIESVGTPGLAQDIYVGRGLIQMWDGERFETYRDKHRLEEWLYQLASTASHHDAILEAGRSIRSWKKPRRARAIRQSRPKRRPRRG